jgi:hypothetical protein
MATGWPDSVLVAREKGGKRIGGIMQRGRASGALSERAGAEGKFHVELWR